MAKVTFSNKWGRVQVQKTAVMPAAEANKSAEDAVREMKKSQKSQASEEIGRAHV